MNETFEPIYKKPDSRRRAFGKMPKSYLDQSDVFDWPVYEPTDPTRRISPQGFSYQSRFGDKPDYK